MTGKTSGEARRRGLLAAVSVLSVSLGMASAHADTPQDSSKWGADQQKGSSSGKANADSIFIKGGSSQLKIDSTQQKGQSSLKLDSTQLKIDSTQQKVTSSQLKIDSTQQKGDATTQSSWK
jgi:hypothetical protein